MKNAILVLVGAVVGGAVGYAGAAVAYQYGFYAMVLPGGLLGFGAAYPAHRSVALAIFCGVAATLLGLYAEFTIHLDVSFEWFIHNIHNLGPVTLVMVGLGGFLGFWLPYQRTGRRIN